MKCTECNGRGVATYYVETHRDENSVTMSAREDICHTCNGSGKKTMTNADCIRSMSDEELVIAISQMIIKEVKSVMYSEGKVPTAIGLAFLCTGVRDRVEMWLRQECE